MLTRCIDPNITDTNVLRAPISWSYEEAPRLIFASILILIGVSCRCGATVYNSNGTPENVQFIHDNEAQNGDTITIPLGTFHWSSPITITKAIKLQGAGSGRIIGWSRSSQTFGTGT